MPLPTECPRCPAPVAPVPGGGWACPEHGPTPALRRPVESSYDEFVVMLADAGDFPTLLPWPMSPGWVVSDFAVVGEQPARATMTCSSGTSALDGPVDVFVVSEESGVGLGARCAGIRELDPGPEVGAGPPQARVRIGTQAVPLWPVSTASADTELDRSVFVGEAGGRWLWVVLRPAPAMLLLRDEWILRDVSGIGPPLVELGFGGPRPTW
ncbi:DUF6758 family protein [Nocardioides cynanchi]|uniref:DUF6758 family protein n=1 Tax=Nocardioides cynanchi TaxID=2558918 RepID=UPI001248C506|nr:DUF6758 family protein [Nocardioides cynanchi]